MNTTIVDKTKRREASPLAKNLEDEVAPWSSHPCSSNEAGIQG